MPSSTMSRARSRSRSRSRSGTVTSLSDAHAHHAASSSGRGGSDRDGGPSGQRRNRSRSLGRKAASIRGMLTRDKSTSSIRSSATAHTARSSSSHHHPKSMKERRSASRGRIEKASGSSSTGRARYDVDLPGAKKKVLKSLSSRRLRVDRSRSPSRSVSSAAAARRAERERDRKERERKERERKERRERAAGNKGDGQLRSERERYESRRSRGDRDRRAPASVRRGNVRIEGGPMASWDRSGSPTSSPTSSPEQNQRKSSRPSTNRMSSDASVGSTGSDAKSAVTSASFYMRSQRRDPLAHARRLTSSRHSNVEHNRHSDWDVSKKRSKDGDIFEQHAQREEELVVAFGKRGGDNRAPGEKWKERRRRSRSRDRLPELGVADTEDDDEEAVTKGRRGADMHARESCPSMRETSGSSGSVDDGEAQNGDCSVNTGGAAASMRALRTRMQSIASLNLQSEEHDAPPAPQAINLKPKNTQLNIPPPSACASNRSICSAPAMSHSIRRQSQEQRRPSFGSLVSGLSGLTSNLKLAGLGAEIEVTQEAMERRAERRRERAAAGGGSSAGSALGGFKRSTNKSINTVSTDVSGLTMTEWEGLDETDGYGDGTRHADSEDDGDSPNEGEDGGSSGDCGEDSGDDATTVYGPDRSKRKEMFEDDAFKVVDGLITLASEQPPSPPRTAVDNRRFSFKSTKSLGNLFLG